MNRNRQPKSMDIDLLGELFSNSFLLVYVAREQVEAQDTDWLINQFVTLPESTTVALVFSGYENDPRELWEVTEVRDYVRKVLTSAPLILQRLIIECRSLLRDCLSDHHITDRNSKGVTYECKITPLWFDIASAAGINPLE